MFRKPILDVIDVDTHTKINYSDLPLFGYCASEPTNQSVNKTYDKIKISNEPPSPVIQLNNAVNYKKPKTPKLVPATSQPVTDTQILKEELEIHSVLLTVPDVCKMLNISRSTLIRLEKSGHIPGRMMLGGSVRYHRETISEWLRNLATNPS